MLPRFSRFPLTESGGTVMWLGSHERQADRGEEEGDS